MEKLRMQNEASGLQEKTLTYYKFNENSCVWLFSRLFHNLYGKPFVHRTFKRGKVKGVLENE